MGWIFRVHLCISIHALLAESDSRSRSGRTSTSAFLSTLSLRRATRQNVWSPQARAHFYPRSPCGERRLSQTSVHICWLFLSSRSLRRATAQLLDPGLDVLGFLSTLSLRRATVPELPFLPYLAQFLSTLSLRRATCYSLRYSAQNRHFYPRSPCGERPGAGRRRCCGRSISIHALLAESDLLIPLPLRRKTTFLSTLSLRRATTRRRSTSPLPCYFYPRSPCGERH